MIHLRRLPNVNLVLLRNSNSILRSFSSWVLVILNLKEIATILKVTWLLWHLLWMSWWIEQRYYMHNIKCNSSRYLSSNHKLPLFLLNQLPLPINLAQHLYFPKWKLRDQKGLMVNLVNLATFYLLLRNTWILLLCNALLRDSSLLWYYCLVMR